MVTIMNNSKLTVAVHILALMAIEKRPLTSTYIANSVNTNPVVIRRLLAPLLEGGFVTTTLGSDGGAGLARSAEQISLLDVYQAIEHGPLFALHNNHPSPLCPCGRNIQPILNQVFADVETAIEAVLAGKTIADVAQEIRQHEPTLAFP